MRKFSLITVVLLLSAAWVVAQTSPSSPSSTQNPSSTQSPSSTSPSAQQPETSASNTGNEKGEGQAIEGCLNGAAGNYTLTDAAGTSYQLSGDTSKLAEHVGHQIKVWGDAGGSTTSSTTSPSGASASATASSPQTLNVKKVKMVSSSCSTK